MTKEQIEEIVKDSLDRQKEEYNEWLADNCQMASPSAWKGSLANDIAFEITKALKEEK